ncbi:MAG: DPP IV N-terminal domain-containing protein [Acidobacteriota bacterium]
MTLGGVTRIGVVGAVIALVPAVPLVFAQEAAQSEREAMYERYLKFPSYVKGGSIQPHWMADGSSFWYAEGGPENTVIWKVDPKANTKIPLFDTARLRQALTPMLGHELPYQGLPFAEFTFVDDSETAVNFTVEDKEFILQLDTYTITRAPDLSKEEKSRLVPQTGEVPSPDRRWFASSKDHNIWLRSSYDGRSAPLTTDGIKDYEWSVAGWGDQGWWSPDSSKLAVKKVDSRKVEKMPVVHWLKPTEEVTWAYYPIAGGPVAQIELFVLDVLSRQRVGVGVWPTEEIYILGWRPDSSELLFVRSDREYKKFELVAADPTTGAKRVVLREMRQTFVNGWDFSRTSLLTFLEDGKKFIWMSERDGWNHLYLFDIHGNLIRRLTEGTFPIVEVASVDGKTGWVYFTAHKDKNRPYDTHLYRVNLEAKGFERLTESPGQHAMQFAPSKEFFLDTHSSVDRPPIVELRRAEGTLLQTLSRANIDGLKELNWKPPEEFVVRAADGKTDLCGVLYKPFNFNPNKKYPVIEVVYGDARIAQAVRRTFIPRLHDQWAHELAQLGFITLFVDPRGTAHRGKDFQDVFYGNVGSQEKIADYVATLKQLAGKRPYMDLSRVGIMGHSAGGYHALRAMLLATDVYHVGVASAAPADGSVIPWEYYMGLPENNKKGYEFASNLPMAKNLKGKLLLIVGTNDVLFSRTIKMVDALIRASKHFDLVLLPEKGHSLHGVSRYWREAIRCYFQEHLKP